MHSEIQKQACRQSYHADDPGDAFPHIQVPYDDQKHEGEQALQEMLVRDMVVNDLVKLRQPEKCCYENHDRDRDDDNNHTACYQVM